MICVMTLGCDESLREFAGPTPDLEPTFSAIQRDIFNAPDSAAAWRARAVTIRPGARFNGMNLTGATAYAALVNVASVRQAGRYPRGAGRSRRKLSGAEDRRRAGHRRRADAADAAVT